MCPCKKIIVRSHVYFEIGRRGRFAVVSGVAGVAFPVLHTYHYTTDITDKDKHDNIATATAAVKARGKPSPPLSSPQPQPPASVATFTTMTTTATK